MGHGRMVERASVPDEGSSDEVRFQGRAPSSFLKYLVGAIVGGGLMGGGAIGLRQVETKGQDPAALLTATRELQDARGEVTVLRSRVAETERSQTQILDALRTIQTTQAQMAGSMESMREELRRMSERKR